MSKLVYFRQNLLRKGEGRRATTCGSHWVGSSDSSGTLSSGRDRVLWSQGGGIVIWAIGIVAGVRTGFSERRPRCRGSREDDRKEIYVSAKIIAPLGAYCRFFPVDTLGSGIRKFLKCDRKR